MSLNLDKSTWTRVAFGAVVRNANETVSNPDAAGIDRVIAMEHLDPGELKIQRWGNLANGTTFTRRVKPGQTLFGKRRAYQRKVALAEFDAICSGDIYTFEADDAHMLPEFLPFLVQSNGFFAHALGTSAGSLSPRTNWRDLADYEFDLPPLDEQKRIADLLWAFEQHQRKLAGESTALALLGDRSRDHLLDAYRWNSRLGDFLHGITAGRSLAASNAPAEESSFGVLKVSAVAATGFTASENKELLDQGAFMSKFSIRSGDLVITRANTSDYVGRAAIVDADYPNLMLSDKTLRLDVNAKRALTSFVFEALKSTRIRAAIAVRASGTGAAMKNISQVNIRDLPMPTIPISEQARVVQHARSIHNGASRLEAESRALTEAKSSILAATYGGS